MPLPYLREMATMPQKYPVEVCDCAGRTVINRLSDHPSVVAACKTLALKPDVCPESLRRWVLQAHIDTGSDQRLGDICNESHRGSHVALNGKSARCWHTRKSLALLEAHVIPITVRTWARATFAGVSRAMSFCPPAARLSARWWPAKVPGYGHEICPQI